MSFKIIVLKDELWSHLF